MGLILIVVMLFILCVINLFASGLLYSWWCIVNLFNNGPLLLSYLDFFIITIPVTILFIYVMIDYDLVKTKHPKKEV